MRRVALLAAGSVAAVGTGVLVMLVATSSSEPSMKWSSPFDAKDCASGYVDGGVVDYLGTDGAKSVQQARARAERSVLREEVRAGSTPALTSHDADRQVWTYHDATGRPLAEVVLERAGEGWRLAGSQQCAPMGVAEIQETPDG